VPGWRRAAAPAAYAAGATAVVVLAAGALAWWSATGRPAEVAASADQPPAPPVARPANPAPPPPAAVRPAWPGLIPTAWTVARPPVPRYEPPPEPPIRWAEQVLAELKRAPEVGLHLPPGVPLPSKRRAQNGVTHPALELFDHRSDLQGLPVLRGSACQLDPTAARTLDEKARSLRVAFADVLATALNTKPAFRRAALQPYRARLEEAGFAEAHAPLLVQMFQCDNETVRELLVELLERAKGAPAGRALAQRALFEPDPALRERAVLALQLRPAEDVRPALLDAFRHPWPAAADHAATALVALNDRAAVPGLLQFLDAPHPAGPFTGDDGTPLVREVVRINHHRNCQLCHAPSPNSSDPTRAPVPSPDRPLPSFSPQSPSSSPYGSAAPDDSFVRFDVTYLRQDFSLLLEVENPGVWPKLQRFDFFVRTRPAYAWETARHAPGGASPQREAALRALRRLTGRDFGDRADDWRDGLRRDTRFGT
jgi:hypothetical protein